MMKNAAASKTVKSENGAKTKHTNPKKYIKSGSFLLIHPFAENRYSFHTLDTTFQNQGFQFHNDCKTFFHLHEGAVLGASHH